MRIGAAHAGAVGADEPPGEEADHKSCEKKNMSSISMICFLQVSMYKFGLGVVRKATSVTFYVLPDLPTSFPPITATLTVFFCFLDNPLKMLKGLVFF